mgnify:CR=1 FL=1
MELLALIRMPVASTSEAVPLAICHNAICYRSAVTNQARLPEGTSIAFLLASKQKCILTEESRLEIDLEAFHSPGIVVLAIESPCGPNGSRLWPVASHC